MGVADDGIDEERSIVNAITAHDGSNKKEKKKVPIMLLDDSRKSCIRDETKRQKNKE